MLNYIVVSGIAISILFILSEVGINVLGNMMKTKRAVGIPIKIQLVHAMKNKFFSK